MRREQIISRLVGGIRLGKQLREKKLPKPVVLAIPRGGVIVGKEIADQLECPFGIILSRKIGSPADREIAIGAIGENREILLADTEYARQQDPEAVQQIIVAEQSELERRRQEYGITKRLPSLRRFTVIIADDGIATGATVEAAIIYALILQAQSIVVATPVCALDALHRLETLYPVKVESLVTPDSEDFKTVITWYFHFPEVQSWEVVQILNQLEKSRRLRT